MNWLNKIENTVGGWFHKSPQSDPQAPIKTFMKNAPQTTGNPNLDANIKLKRELLGGFKKGGKVKRTGVYRLHKGERVLNKKQELARKMRYDY